MKVGDLVRIKQPFQPASSLQPYQFAIVVGVVSEDSKVEILVHLFNPESSTVYMDESGAKAVYSFRPNEVEYAGDRPSDTSDLT